MVHIDKLTIVDYTQGVLLPWNEHETGDSDDVAPDETTTDDPLLADWLGLPNEPEWGDAVMERYFYD